MKNKAKFKFRRKRMTPRDVESSVSGKRNEKSSPGQKTTEEVERISVEVQEIRETGQEQMTAAA